MSKKHKRRKKDYPNGGDGMFFYHKLTKHPAKQIAHTLSTWTNRRYTHHPNNLSNYRLDIELSSEDEQIYYHKTIFIDKIFTRGLPYRIKKKKS